jgi:hypothetical protein
MFLLPRRQIWTQQPQGAVDIDWSNPLTRGLTYATADGAGGADSSITSLGSVPKIADRWGKGDYFDGSSQKIAKNSLVGRSLDLTVCVLHKSTVLPPNGPTYCHILASTTGASPADYYGWILMLGNGTGLPQFRVYQSINGTQDAECDAATGALNDGKPHVTIATVFGEAGGAMTLDVDGKTVASSTHPTGLYSRTNNLAIGKARHNFWGGFKGSIGAVFVFDRVLSAKERSSLSANPWQIFKRPDSRIFVPVSVGGGTTSLIVQDATHAHIADSPSFSMATYLAVAESLHAHAADNVTLATTGTANLVVQEATHAHVADGVTLTTQWLLAVAEALHSHTAESVTLSLQTALVVLEALHTHAAENLTLGVTGTANLTIADATSGHTSDAVSLTLNSLLAVFDASHAHAADSLTLDTSNATALTVQDSTHTHGADSLGLSLDTWLAIVEAAHGHTADAPTLSTALALQVAESLHAHYADVVVLGFPSAPGSGPTVEEIVAAVLAALNATTIPVDVHKVLTIPVTGNWPTANENADALLARNWP